jgi:8-oxo-dGTP diphosphatase
VNPFIQVAVGLIVNSAGELLIAQRPLDKPYGGLWEFPGGKIEAGESVFKALQRELLEELGIRVNSAEPWLQTEYAYPEKTVLLHTWIIKDFVGDAEGREGQLVRWVLPNTLDQYQFPAGNQLILEKVRECIK